MYTVSLGNTKPSEETTKSPGYSFMKLFQLEYFVAAGSLGSISKASDSLHVARQAVTRAIRDLEEEYRILLFSRSSSGVELTPPGRSFYEKSLQILHLVQELDDDMKMMRKEHLAEPRRLLRIGLSFTARYCLLPLLCEFEKTFPDTRVEITELAFRCAETWILEDRADICIALCPDPDVFDSVHHLDIGKIEFVFACSRAHPLAARKSVSVLDIQNEPMVGLESLMCPDNQIDRIYSKYGRKPYFAYTTSQVSMMMHMLKANQCVTIKPRPVVAGDPDIAVIPFTEPITVPLRIYCGKDDGRNSTLNDFICYMTEHCPP